MRATCILLCLTLPHAIVGNIFGQQRQHDNRMRGVFVQPMGYLDQLKYQQGQQYQNPESNDITYFIKEIQRNQRQWGHNNHQHEDTEQQRRDRNQNKPEDQYNQLTIDQQQRNKNEVRGTPFAVQGQITKKQDSDSSSQENSNSQDSSSSSSSSGSSSSQSNSQEDSKNQDSSSSSSSSSSQENSKGQDSSSSSQSSSQENSSSSGSSGSSSSSSSQSESQEKNKRRNKDDSSSSSSSSQSSSQEGDSASRGRQSDSSSSSSSQSSSQEKDRRQNKPQSRNQKMNTISWKGLSIRVGGNSPVTKKEDIKKIFGDALETMPDITDEQKIKFHQAYLAAARSENKDARLTATQLLKKFSYNAEEHSVKTEDGYILTMIRIAPKPMTRDVRKRPVVFLMHDLMGSADDWLLAGPGRALAYQLADAGYDVWLGNARGSKYSRHHVSKHASLPEFWQYSMDEIALHDLPTMMDYVLEHTRQQKMFYVGHGQGAAAFFALAATRPAYNKKVIEMFALSPMAYMKNARSPLVKMIAPNSGFYEALKEELGNGEFMPTKAQLATFGGDMLRQETGCKNVSATTKFVIAGVNMEQMKPEEIPMVVAHMTSGASVRQIKQLGQAAASGEFRMYNFGERMNEKVYGSRQAPKYELSAVTTPVVLMAGEADWLAAPRDVKRLQSELPQATTYQVPQKHFGNMDFQLGKSAPEAVYKRIIQAIQKKTTY